MSTLRYLIVLVIASIAMAIVGLNVIPANAGAYAVGKSLIGLHERKHRKSLQKRLGVNPRRTPWCGAFVGYAVKRDGLTLPPGHLRAINWRNWGYPVSLGNARIDDVVVIRTGYGNHVTIFAGMASKSRFKGLGGNQSNQVKISHYRVSSIVAIRRGRKPVKHKFFQFLKSKRSR